MYPKRRGGGEGRQGDRPRHPSMQAKPARFLASMASGNSRRHHGVVIGAQARSTARCKQIVEVYLGRGRLVPPARGGWGGPEEGETKRHGKRSAIGREVR